MKEPGFYGVVEVATGKTLLFMPRLPEEFAVWMGRLHSTDDVKKMYSVDEVHYVEDVSNTFHFHSFVAPWYHGLNPMAEYNLILIRLCSAMGFKTSNRSDILLREYRSNRLSLICPNDVYCVVKSIMTALTVTLSSKRIRTGGRASLLIYSSVNGTSTVRGCSSYRLAAYKCPLRDLNSLRESTRNVMAPCQPPLHTHADF